MTLASLRRIDGRGERIRTSDSCVPNAVLYQAELHPDSRFARPNVTQRSRSAAKTVKDSRTSRSGEACSESNAARAAANSASATCRA